MIESLKQATLYEELDGNIQKQALTLSGGQQQRLCIATSKIEELIHHLKKQYTIVIVTHNMQQAGRISDKTAFLYMGKLIEYGNTKKIFTNPAEERTENYITGRFG